MIASLTLGLLGGAVLLADGAQTGTLVGVVLTENGMPIPEANVRITGTALMGERLLTTGPTGVFRAPSLPPGSAYEVTVVAGGYQTAQVTARISVNQIYQITVQLQPLAANIVEVVALGTSIDTSTVTSPTNSTRQMIDNLPMPLGRNYQGVMALTPGLTGKSNPNALGALDSENLYLMDGVDTTDATTGTFSMNLNLDAIEEVQVLTTGLSAEYGRFGGAIANVVTRSGGNTFEGSLRYAFYNRAWDASGKFPKPESYFISTPALSLGGPIVKDRLWYFVTAQSQKHEEGKSIKGITHYTQAFKSDPVTYTAKLSWQINPNHSLVLQTTADPTYIDNIDPQKFPAGNLAAVPDQRQEVQFASLTYRAVPRQDVTFDMKLARHDHRLDVTSNAGETIPNLSITDKHIYENIPEEAFLRRNRSQFNAAMTWYPEQHQIKIGVDYQASKSTQRTRMPGGSTLLFETIQGELIPRALWTESANVQSQSKQDYQACYLNDSWRMGQHFVANLGLRVEKTLGKNDAGSTIWDHTGISPRVGFTYDWKGDGRQNIGTSYSRYMIVPKHAILDALSTQKNSVDTYFYWEPVNTNPYDPKNYQIATPQANMFNSYQEGLTAAYVDEIALIAKWQLSDEWVFTTQGVARDYKNPMFLYEYFDVTSNTDPALKHYTQIRNSPDAQHQYRAWINTLDFQGSSLNLRLSYVFSGLHGNYDLNTSDDSYSKFFEGKYIPEFNDARAWGRLTNDQPHDIQLMTSYRLRSAKWSLIQGLHASYLSGRAWTLQGLLEGKNLPEGFQDHPLTLRENGRRGEHRFPSLFGLHYSLNASYCITQTLQLQLGVDIHNVLNWLRPEGYTIGPNEAYIDNGARVFKKNPTFGQSIPEDYTPGRKVNFVAILRF